MSEEVSSVSGAGRFPARQMISASEKEMLPVLASQPVRRIAIVLGMHRSGTSLLSNIMHYLGCDMADTSDAISDKNPGGFWERPQIVALHDQILELIDRKIGSPQHVLPFPPGWWRRKEIQGIKHELIACVEQALQTTTDLWGFKDPRTCRLLPLWKEVLKAVGAEPLYIHAIRAPEPAARSMSLKNPKLRPLSVAEGELMWLAYNYDIVQQTKGQDVLIIDYDDWFREPDSAADRLVGYLGTCQDLSHDEVMDLVGELVTVDFRHQTDDPGSRHPTIGRSFFEALLVNRDGKEPRSAAAQLPFIRLLFQSIEPLIDQLREIPALRLGVEQGAEAARDLDVRLRQVVELKRERNEVIAQAEQAAAAAAASERVISERVPELESLLSEARARIFAEQGKQQALLDKAAAAAVSERALSERVVALEGLLSEAREQASAERAKHQALIDGAAARAAEEIACAKNLAEEMARHNQDLGKQRAELLAHRVPRLLLGSMRRRSRRLIALLRDARRDLHRQAEFEHREKAVQEELSVVRLELDQMRRCLSLAERRLIERDGQVARLLDEAADARAHLLAAESDRSAVITPMAPIAFVDEAALDVRVGVSGDGIAGHVHLVANPHLALIVEAWVDGKAIASALTLAGAQPHGSDTLSVHPAGHFAIPWAAFPNNVSGRLLSLHLAGSPQALATDIRLPDLTTGRAEPEGTGDRQYREWLGRYRPFGEQERAAARRHLEASSDWPFVSVILLKSISEPSATARSIDSVLRQVYVRWELLVATDAVVAEPLDPRVRTMRAERLAELVAAANGTHICFLEEGDLLAEDALLTLATVAKEDAGDAILYSDEDRFESLTGKRQQPYFKGAWSLDLLLHQDFLTRLAWLPLGRLNRVTGPANRMGLYETLIRIGLHSVPDQLRHVPHILYHRASDARIDPQAEVAAIAAALAEQAPGVELSIDPQGTRSIRWPLPDPLPRITLIVPTRDRLDLLRTCVEGVLRETDYPDIELLIVDNDSVEDDTLAYLRAVGRDARVKILRWSGAFDYSAINNFAAEQASGSIIALLNNDLRMQNPHWLTEMVRHVVREDVGVVGARLLYEDGTLQHAGIVMGIGTASHRYKNQPAGHPGHGGHLLVTHDVTAVTAACLLIRKAVWDEVGGLSEDFPVAYNDVDLCLKVRAAGYRILFEPRAMLYHLESQSRGLDKDEAKRARLAADRERLIARWPDVTTIDPFYNPNLTLAATDAGLAYPPRVARVWDDTEKDSASA